MGYDFNRMHEGESVIYEDPRDFINLLSVKRDEDSGRRMVGLWEKMFDVNVDYAGA